MPLPAAPPMILTDSDRNRLKALSRYRSTPQGILVRINIVLEAAAGEPNREIARKLSTSVPTVLLWRKRYRSDGLNGILEDRPRSGRPKRILPAREAAIVDATMTTKPRNSTQRSVRMMAVAQKVSPATVQRIWEQHKLQPHRVESSKFSNDPEFAARVRDIVGLYMRTAGEGYGAERGREEPDSGPGPWTAPSRYCLCGRACPSGRRMTMNGTGPRCSPP